MAKQTNAEWTAALEAEVARIQRDTPLNYADHFLAGMPPQEAARRLIKRMAEPLFAYDVVRSAEVDLNRVLSRGERRDLLTDQFNEWSRETVFRVEQALYAGPGLGPLMPGSA